MPLIVRRTSLLAAVAYVFMQLGLAQTDTSQIPVRNAAPNQNQAQNGDQVPTQSQGQTSTGQAATPPNQIRNKSQDVSPKPQTNSDPNAKKDQDSRDGNDRDNDTGDREHPSEFQKFVYSSSGQMLRVFGRNLFTTVPSTFAPADRIAVPDDYVIGPGDEIQIHTWGQLDMDFRANVDRLGNIFIPKVGTLVVANLKYSQLKGFLLSSIGRNFKDFDLSVSLGQLRSIPIFVVGQVRRPGSYTVSALSTLVNAIFASGGPSSGGSMRHIQLKRGATIVRDFDLYDLLLSGDKSKDSTLLAGDVIYVPPVGPLVAVIGSVNSPAIYEVNTNSTLAEVLAAAGGLTPVAAGDKATVERIQGRSVRNVQEFSLDGDGLKNRLQDGDLITVRSLSARFDNAVTLRGNVSAPGRYPWRLGMRISDLIPSREALVSRKFWDAQSELGKVESTSKTKPDLEPTARVRTESTDPALTEKENKNAAIDVIEKRIPNINWAYALLQRFNKQTLSNDLLPFNLGEALSNKNGDQNLELQPGDSVTVFTVSDIQVPHSEQIRFVRLEGEFRTAGVYQVNSHETLKQLVERVGGFTPSAYLYGLEFNRESARLSQDKRYDEFLADLEREVQAENTRSTNVLSAEEAAGLKEKIESDRRLVERLRQVRPTGRVVFGIRPDQDSIAALPELLLEDGDRLFVPYRPATINVVGAVYNESSFLYKPQHRVSYYLRLAGGGTRQSDTAHMFVIRADGSILSKDRSSGWFTNKFEDVALMPGDTVVIPQKLSRPGFMRGLRDWSQILSQFGLGAAAITTLTH